MSVKVHQAVGKPGQRAEVKPIQSDDLHAVACSSSKMSILEMDDSPLVPSFGKVRALQHNSIQGFQNSFTVC